MYPFEILPQKNYKIIDSELLCKNYNVYLLRRSALEKPLDGNGKVKFDALIELGKEDRFYTLSWNLFGVFKEKHTKFIVKSKDSKEWHTGDVIPNVEDINFEECETAVLYLSCKSIYNYPFLYTNKELKEKEKSDKKSDKKGFLLIEHKPLNVNFWHFQFFVLKENGEPIKNASSKNWTLESLKRNSQTKILLINNMSISAPSEFDECPKELYLS